VKFIRMRKKMIDICLLRQLMFFLKLKQGALLIHLRNQSKITWSLLQIRDKYSLVILMETKKAKACNRPQLAVALHLSLR